MSARESHDFSRGRDVNVSTVGRHQPVVRDRTDEPPPPWAAIAEFPEFYDRQILYCPKTTVIASVHESDNVAFLLLLAGHSLLLEQGTTTIWAVEKTG